MREIRTSGLMWRTEAPEPLGPTLPMTYRTLLERFVLKPPQEISSFMPKPNRGAVMPSIWRFFSLRRSPPFQRPNRFFSDEL